MLLDVLFIRLNVQKKFVQFLNFYQTKPEGGLAIFYTSPKGAGQTVITDAQRVKGLIEEAKQTFFKESNAISNTGIKSSNQVDSTEPANYDDDYYYDDDKAEIKANFIGKDYTDEDEFYDYEEYDSIVDRRSSADSPMQRSLYVGDKNYDYDYYDEIGKEKTSINSIQEPNVNGYHNYPQNNFFKRRNSFSSVDYNQADDEKYDEWNKSDYNSEYEEEKDEKRQPFIGNTPSLYNDLTYDGRHVFHHAEKGQDSLPNNRPLVSTDKYTYNRPQSIMLAQQGKFRSKQLSIIR